MKRIIFLLFSLTFSLSVFAQTTDATMTTRSEQIRDETTAGANTANRVGTLFKNITDSKVNIIYGVTASGTDTYTASVNATVISYVTGQHFLVLFTNGNTGAATLNINSIGERDIRKNGTTALASGDIPAGSYQLLAYDGTNLQLVGKVSASGSFTWGSGTGTLSDQTDLQSAIDAKENLLETVSSSTAGATITLDFTNDTQKIFVGSATFATSKAVALSNDTNAEVFDFHFEVTNVAATLNFPANVQMFDEGWDVGTTTWTPPAIGEYEIAGSFDGTNWRIKRIGPYDTTPTGGGGTPGGSDTQVQYNDASAFGGEADFAYNETTNTLTVDNVAVDAEAYNATNWNGDLTVPTKDDVRDELEQKLESTDVTGTQDLFVSATAMWPRTTGGCADLAKTEVATSLFNIQTLNFDSGTDEFAQFQVTLPRKWNNGTITVVVYWTTSASSGDVIWSISGGAYSNDDPLSTAFGSAQTVTDTFLAANDVHISSATSAITLAGTPADSDFLAFQISRDADNGSDTLNGDAKLLGISIRLTTDAAKDN